MLNVINFFCVKKSEESAKDAPNSSCGNEDLMSVADRVSAGWRKRKEGLRGMEKMEWMEEEE
jgi:hypothetical protein